MLDQVGQSVDLAREKESRLLVDNDAFMIESESLSLSKIDRKR